MKCIEKSMLEMGRGAIAERVDYEMAKVINNIMDANTDPIAKRKLSLTLEFKPDAERMNIQVNVTAKSTLAPTNPVHTSLYVATDTMTGEMQVVEMVPEMPGQMGLDGMEQEAPAKLRIING